MGDADFAGCREHFPNGQPPALPAGLTGLHALCFDAFAVLYSSETRTPVYVAQRLNRASLQAARAVGRSDHFYAEARLPASARAQLEDYRGSGYARGHMAPAADMPTEAAMAQSFSLANMVPQDMGHNSGPWNRIEQDTRQYVMRARGDVYVFTGPAYLAARTSRIGDSGVAVPSHLFKLVHDPATGRAWAHWHQNQAGPQAMKPISEEALVQKLGIDFLHGAD
ncbi:DNA/RNA non-specific endonuclease [Xenophilus arseniciresistens]|uniref:DNA/RNA non-specific endonuclease n=1 Tax=Xenophilus arseniciresistens TaxID=1283306 RepID=UPI002FE0596F